MMPLKFEIKKRPKFSSQIVVKARKKAVEKIAELVFQELFILTSGKLGGDEDVIGMKTGSLRKSLRIDFVGDSFIAYFDPRIAEHASFVIEGTRFIKGRNIMVAAVQRVRESAEFARILKDFTREICI